MAAPWEFAVGNLVSLAPRAPAAVSPAAEDAELPLEQLGSGYPDEEGALTWRSDGSYAIDFDLNLLAEDSERADAPTGWLDLLNLLGGTPGLPANPPDWGTYGGRAGSLRLYRPVVQEIPVMPGVTVRLDLGIRWPAAAAGATGVRLRVVDPLTGEGWNGSAWVSGGVVASQTVADTWLDVLEDVEPDPDRAERTVYQVIVEPIATSFGATSYCYASTPAAYAEVDLAAIIGHTIPGGATVTLAPAGGGGTPIVLTPLQPSFGTVAGTSQLVRTWRLSITMPAGVQPRPVLGEVWIGKVGTFTAQAPILPVTMEDGDPDQVRSEGARRRQEVVGSGGRLPVAFALTWRVVGSAAYRQLRDSIARLTEHGVEPMLLIPSSALNAGAALFHGRLGNEIGYVRETPADLEELVSCSWEFVESPMAAR